MQSKRFFLKISVIAIIDWTGQKSVVFGTPLSKKYALIRSGRSPLSFFYRDYYTKITCRPDELSGRSLPQGAIYPNRGHQRGESGGVRCGEMHPRGRWQLAVLSKKARMPPWRRSSARFVRNIPMNSLPPLILPGGVRCGEMHPRGRWQLAVRPGGHCTGPL